MSLWVVVGGQYGGEGKGKISAFITQREDIDVCIRCGGPNSGHTFVTEKGQTMLLRQLPTGYIRPQTRVLIPAGALIDLEVLKQELDALALDPRRVGVDRNAMIIESGDKEREVGLEEANSALDHGKKVLVEGTQGFGLSLYHSDSYPKATSRDTTAAGFLSEVGLSPLLVTEIVLVFRTFPIRVAGEQAGPLKDEITWETVQRESGYPVPVHEMTTVSKKLRRVGRFDWNQAVEAVRVNRPTRLAVNGLDFLGYKNKGVHDIGSLTRNGVSFLNRVQATCGVPVWLYGTSPDVVAVLLGVKGEQEFTKVEELCV